jgi:hypothetical protein
MEDFVYTALPIRVVFGHGTVSRLPRRFVPSAARGRSSCRRRRSGVTLRQSRRPSGPSLPGSTPRPRCTRRSR